MGFQKIYNVSINKYKNISEACNEFIQDFLINAMGRLELIRKNINKNSAIIEFTKDTDVFITKLKDSYEIMIIQD
ncbi:hypothetical protein [Fusobacterium phage Fnu1]|uniref:Uncharacterized protein n=1 Tax=Fusobacterium phage Fnu1 TaxID=2530024 RepID=A0A481W709_9CAUD|nr:hypothetical protein KMD24_gp051 [Fusobacterium phage Fnu1]QBJ04211.1 hypothetical protein [Fusobacterium phage Fnu1]